MLYNRTYNLDQVAFALEGTKDVQQTMTAMKAANKELKGMVKIVGIEDIDSMQDEMMDLMDVSSEIQETLPRSYNVPDDIDEEELMGSFMLWKLIWTSNQIQTHRTSNQTRRQILILRLTYMLHQVVTSQQTGSRRMNWDCLRCRTHQFVPENNKKKPMV